MKLSLVLLLVGVTVSSVFCQSRNASSKGGQQIVEVQPSYSYQFHTNDDEHLQKIVVSSINAKIPDDNSAKLASANYVTGSAANNNNRIYPSHYGSPPSNFVTSQFKPILNNNNPQKTSQIYGVQPGIKINNRQQQQKPIYQKQQNPVYNPQTAQRRTDYYSVKDEERYEDPEDPEGYQGRYEDAEDSPKNEDEVDDDGYEEKDKPEDMEKDPYPAPSEDFSYEPDPETRENIYGQGIPPSGPQGFVGPASFDPLPPPPPVLKGSVDYILIPLVLIGLAGPIFVVLYVILGAFEAKLAPISRSLGGYGAYKPYLDNLMSSVGRSLDKNECLDYAACQFGSFCNTLGYTEDSGLKRTLDSITPHPYKRTMRKLFDSMRQPKDCVIGKCINFN